MRRLAIISALVAVALGATTFSVLRSPEPKEDASLYAPFRVDETSPRIISLKLKAAKGSADAAADLAEMYGHCHKSGLSAKALKACLASERYWIDVAVENGSNVGINYKIHSLIVTGSCVDAYRAEFLYGHLAKTRTDDSMFKALSEDIKQAKQNCS